MKDTRWDGVGWRTIYTDNEVEKVTSTTKENLQMEGVWYGWESPQGGNGRYKEHKERHGVFRLRILLRITKLPTNLQ
jgi:hypothetical protein